MQHNVDRQRLEKTEREEPDQKRQRFGKSELATSTDDEKEADEASEGTMVLPTP